MDRKATEKVSQFINESIGLLNSGQIDQAAEIIRRAVSLNQPQQDMYFTQGLCMYAVDDLQGAVKSVAKELELFPQNKAAQEFLNSVAVPAKVVQPAVSKTKRIAVAGNCQAQMLGVLLSYLLPESDISIKKIRLAEEYSQEELSFNFNDFDHVFTLRRSEHFWPMSYENCKDKPNTAFVPELAFAGYHPDCTYVYDQNGAVLKSPIGDYQSLIVYCSYINGLNTEECAELFNPKFFAQFGFYAHFASCLRALEESLDNCGFDGAYFCGKWQMQGPFMYSVNHPKLFVMLDIARELCRQNNIEVRPGMSSEAFIADHNANLPIFPSYPGIDGSRGAGNIYFKGSHSGDGRNINSGRLFNLEEFINGSYSAYSQKNKGELVCRDVRVESFTAAVKEFRKQEKTKFKHPYKKLPEKNYWSRSISKKEMKEVDPVASFPTLIDPNTKVATAGSCFAQHVARALMKSGLNYYVAEQGPDQLSEEEKKDLQYGLFSARFGNLYTAKQLVQLFERAYGTFTPLESYWQAKDGTYLDPYRPNIGQKFSSIADLEEDREKHLCSVREMFENLDVFVFTLGLTEGWVNLVDGSVYPVSPGVVSENEDQNQYGFVNFEYQEVCDDLVTFLGHLRTVNPEAKVIFTVSPVPLIATYEDRHVLSSTTLSKSVLRAAADKVAKSFPFVEYYPSYEIITGNFNRGEYFAEDLRGVRDQGVQHVMKLFIKHCTGVEVLEDSVQQTESAIDKIVRQNNNDVSEVICDEELLEN